MIGLKHIAIILILLSGMHTCLFAQDTDFTDKPAKPDTVVLSSAQLEPITIPCPVMSEFGNGREELLVISSYPDMQSAFGYNCNYPDIDFSLKTLLRINIANYDSSKTKVSMIGDKVILSLYQYKRYRTKYNLLCILIPKIGLKSDVALDINELETVPMEYEKADTNYVKEGFR
jgi:hypothetical protein